MYPGYIFDEEGSSQQRRRQELVPGAREQWQIIFSGSTTVRGVTGVSLTWHLTGAKQVQKGCKGELKARVRPVEVSPWEM